MIRRKSEFIPVKTKWGIFRLFVTKKGLYSVQFPGKNPMCASGVCLNAHRVCERTVKVIQNYFKDPARKLDLKLDLSGCTLFERRVYQILRRVPSGRVITYGELARRAGYPGAARAVGTAMKRNRLPIVIPCHRVIRGDGSLGQYSAGITWKRSLLKHEGNSRV